MTITDIQILLLAIAVCKLFVDSAQLKERAHNLEGSGDQKPEAVGFTIEEDPEW